MDIGLEAMIAQYREDIGALGESGESYPFAHWLEYSVESSDMTVSEWAAYCIESRGI